MKKFKKLIALAAMMSLCASQVQAQIYEEGAAYDDSERASYMSILLPVGAVIAAAIIIATTDHHHHHHSHHHRSHSSFSHSHCGCGR